MIVSISGIYLVETSGGTYLNFCKLYQSPHNVGLERINSHLLASHEATEHGDFKFTEVKNGKKSGEGEAYHTNFTKKAVREIQKVAEETGKTESGTEAYGGFCSCRGLATAISQQEMDLIILGKTTCLNPFLCAKILKPFLDHFSCPNPPIPGISLFNLLPGVTFWFLQGLLAPARRPYVLTRNPLYI